MQLQPAIATIRATIPDVLAIYLFGSRASDKTARDSDLDLAVLACSPLGPRARWMLQERLAATLSTDVDLVDLRAASTVMRAQVVSRGRLLFEQDRTVRAMFEAVALAAYARLNEERKHIVADIRQRGTVHG